MKRIICILLLIASFWQPGKAQETFARVRLSRSSVYPGEPFQLTFKVYTSTYYLSPISFDDFYLPSAFIIKFSRTLSGVTKLNGKQYATLEFFFQVYPVEPGVLEIPPVNLSFDSPPEGDFKGKRQIMETESARLTVRPIPDDSPVKPWFLATNVLISDKWTNLNREPRVGDVIEREVLVRAYGTMPNFIPDLRFETGEGIEVYPKSPELHDKRTDEQANGWRTQKILYLLSGDGDVVIPPLELNWFNPRTNRSNVARLDSRTISVLPNPDLGILATIKDSLSVDSSIEQVAISPEAQKTDYRRIAVFIVLWLVLLFIIRKLIKPVKKYFKIKRERQNTYRQSPEWYYRKIFKITNSPVLLLNSMNIWWDLAREGRHPDTISDVLKGTPVLNDWLNLQKLEKIPPKEKLSEILAILKQRLDQHGNNSGKFAINP